MTTESSFIWTTRIATIIASLDTVLLPDEHRRVAERFAARLALTDPRDRAAFLRVCGVEEP